VGRYWYTYESKHVSGLSKDCLPKTSGLDSESVIALCSNTRRTDRMYNGVVEFELPGETNIMWEMNPCISQLPVIAVGDIVHLKHVDGFSHLVKAIVSVVGPDRIEAKVEAIFDSNGQGRLTAGALMQLVGTTLKFPTTAVHKVVSPSHAFSGFGEASMKPFIFFGLCFLSAAAGAKDHPLAQPLIDGCYLTTRSSEEMRTASAERLEQAFVCTTAVESAFEVARSAKTFTYFGIDVCMPDTATPRDVARNVVSLSLTRPEVLKLKPSDIVVTALVHLYRCDSPK